LKKTDEFLEVVIYSLFDWIKIICLLAMRGEKRRRTPHLGDHLHPRNRYANAAPDFYALGKLYPEFRQ
jgi:hypothetical protein